MIQDLGRFGLWKMPETPQSVVRWRRYFWANAFPDYDTAVTYWRDMILMFGGDPDTAKQFGEEMARSHGYDKRRTTASNIERILS